MILLLTTDSDATVNYVAEWLIFYNKPFIRLNEFDPILELVIRIGDDTIPYVTIKTPNHEINFNNITSVWWRGYFFFVEFNSAFQKIESLELKEYLQKEKSSVEFLLHYIIEYNKQLIGSVYKHDINKNMVLLHALSAGFKVPNTTITNIKNEVSRFAKESKISKSLDNLLLLNSTDIGCRLLTRHIGQDELQNIPNSFFTTLFQDEVEKEFEIRVFYLKKKMFSMAIFSQVEPETMIDFRTNYDKLKYAPYQLPVEIEEKIEKLMQLLNLNTGSIDLLLSTDGQYYFLEVNPDGQFNFLSVYSNYYIEKEIALIL